MLLNIAAKMGGKIRIGTEDSSLIDEPAYFDGMHKRVKDFVTLTLWVFHPGMRAMQILGIMECSNENAANIEIFFDTFNKAMGEYLGEEDYVWDPYLLMMDEKGANFEAVACVFDENFRQTKTVTCQFHFLHCAESYIHDIPTEERITFRTLCRRLCEAHTIDRYKKISEKIIAIAEKYGFTGWWKFWSLRSPHIIPALHAFNLPKMNLAEVGKSTMHGHGKMWLMEAAFKDMAALALQSSNYKKFLANREKIMGKGPKLKKKTVKEKENQRKYVQQIDDVLFGGNLANKGKKQFQEPFMPSLRAKHRAPQNIKKTRQGRDEDNDADVIIVEEGTKRKNPQRLGRGKNKCYSQNPVNINPQNDAPHYPMLPDAMEEEFTD